MFNVQELNTEGNPIQFTAAVGRGPARETRFGTAIDVVLLVGGKRQWIDLVVTNPEVLPELMPGVCIEVSDPEPISGWHRTMWRARVKVLER